ncbi:MAG: hypothetical protein HOQ22_02630 [Nocardioidaceae bacterium]|nr:hypothetical protein [Nocardioidaceae bacterium]NUS49921.1 hypothetical protein [Nocardioidaceae bacterium]
MTRQIVFCVLFAPFAAWAAVVQRRRHGSMSADDAYRKDYGGNYGGGPG